MIELVAGGGPGHRRRASSPSPTSCRALFTADPDVLDQAHELWPLFALMRPVAAVVFALDGILIGAGDTRYLAAAMVVAFVVFLPIVLTARHRIAGVWAALDVLMLARLATLGGRFARGRWALVGAQA